MRHTEGMRQSVIMTRKLHYVAFCQGAIMIYDSKLRHYDVRQNGARHSGMCHFTTPPFFLLKLGRPQPYSQILD
jgi:hypothetical protein